MRISSYLSLLLVSSALAPLASAEVSFLLNVDRVNDTGGTPVDVGTGSWLIVADTAQDGFGPIAPGSVAATDFIGGDDRVIFRGDFTTFGTPGVVSGAATGLSFSDGWDAGDPLAFVWFPEGGAARSEAEGGDAYGLYTSVTGEDTSAPWITPADGTLDHSLQLLTSDGNAFFGGGSVEPAAARAGLTVVPEPSAAILGLLTTLLFIRRRR